MNTATLIDFKRITSMTPDALIEKTQQFFAEIHSCGVSDAEKLLAVYSTADMLGTMGLSEDSVKDIKNAAYVKAEILHSSFPTPMAQTWIAMCQLHDR